MPTYRIYYMDNDGQKRILETGLSYQKAIKAWWKYNDTGVYEFCEYELEK